METLTTQTFLTAINSEKPVLVDFTAKWCGPCKRLAPVLEELSKEFTEIDFYKLDIDESSQVKDRFGIRSVPTLMIFKNGRPIAKFVGFSSKEDIRKDIKDTLDKLKMESQ